MLLINVLMLTTSRGRNQNNFTNSSSIIQEFDYEMVVLRSNAGFPPDLESTRMWEASLEKARQPPSASAAFEAFGCRCLVFLVLAPCQWRMCRLQVGVWVAALNLIEAHSHILCSF